MNKPSVKLQDFRQGDLAQLFNYPSIGELFSDGNKHHLDEFLQKLITTQENLEKIIRTGENNEAESAKQALRAVEVTLEFLQTLQEMCPFQQK
jgi:hypothetical protein